ncbi:MAG: hypothetical protein WBX25_01315 [Rhodomicrobium sp.]
MLPSLPEKAANLDLLLDDGAKDIRSSVLRLSGWPFVSGATLTRSARLPWLFVRDVKLGVAVFLPGIDGSEIHIQERPGIEVRLRLSLLSVLHDETSD